MTYLVIKHIPTPSISCTNQYTDKDLRERVLPEIQTSIDNEKPGNPEDNDCNDVLSKRLQVDSRLKRITIDYLLDNHRVR